MNAPPETADCVIIGGGVIGSSAAYFLAKDGRAGRVVVIEPDPLYEFAATPRASGGVRRLFSRPENILMSQFSLGFYQAFQTTMAVQGDAPHLDWRPLGYLFIVPPEGTEGLITDAELQRTLGVEVELLDPAALKEEYPFLSADGIGAAAFSPGDGLLDPNAALQGFKRKARSLGVEYVADRVTALEVVGTAVRRVHLASGVTIAAGAVICAAGCWSAEVAAMVGMPLPVEPMQRHDHYFECATPIDPLPFVKDLGGLGFRKVGRGYGGSVVDHDHPAGHDWMVDHGYFERIVWPALAHRVPAFEQLKLGASWVAHYDRNRLDGNMILGNWPGHLDNFHVACGFSGHGVMHAPAVGRALSELVLEGRFTTLDLTRMGYARIIENQPYAELGIR